MRDAKADFVKEQQREFSGESSIREGLARVINGCK